MHRILAGLILCGGFNFSGFSFAGEWVEKADMPQINVDFGGGIWGLGAAVVDGKIYTIGGQDDLPVPGKTVREYHPEKDNWTDKKKLARGRFRLGAAVVRSKIYVFGGTENNFEAVPAVDEYDPKADAWTEKAAMPTARMGLATAAVGGRIYTIGGAESFFFPSGAVEVYDPATDTWEKQADMPNPRWGMPAVAVKGKIYVFGGAVDNTHQKYTKTVEMYDPKTDTWTPKANLPLAYFDMAASFVNNGRVYLIGGRTFNGKERDGPVLEGWTYHWTVFEYNIERDIWLRSKDRMPGPRGTLATSVVDGKIYAIGGHRGGPRKEVEVYTPDGWPFPKTFSVDPRGKLATVWGVIKRRQ